MYGNQWSPIRKMQNHHWQQHPSQFYPAIHQKVADAAIQSSYYQYMYVEREFSNA